MAFGLKPKLDYSDLRATTDDRLRYELVRGELLVTPSPSVMHQRVSKRLYRILEDYFEGRTLGEVFYAPIDLILTEQDVFVPDLVVVTDPSQTSKRGIESAPVLVVEILSPSTRKRDRGVKARRYAELGVEHYWIVDPGRRRLECYRLAGQAFEPFVEAVDGGILEHPSWDGLTVDLALLWG